MPQETLIKLQCTACKEINYCSRKNRKEHKEKLQLNKFCPKCRKHTLHKEMK